MANLFKSSYSVGKLHTGMIAYLCFMYLEGNKEPLNTFLTNLGTKPPNTPFRPVPEWNGVDLALLPASGGKATKDPLMLIEMKVDDHEHKTPHSANGTKTSDYQTIVYGEKYPSCEICLLITLGMGECFHEPYGDRFAWVGIGKFLHALEQINTEDVIISQWRDAIRNEFNLQTRVRNNERSGAGQFRPGAWNVYFLGNLKEMLAETLREPNVDADLTCYTHGRQPDTILNFGWGYRPRYLEINRNGTLNLKVSFEPNTTDEERRRTFNKCVEYVEQEFSQYPLIEKGKKVLRGSVNSQTVASFNVELDHKAVGDEVKALCYKSDDACGREKTVRTITEIVRKFCATSSSPSR